MRSSPLRRPVPRLACVLLATLALVAAFALPTGQAHAAEAVSGQIELEDGTVVEGTVEPLSKRSVMIKTADGQTMLVPADRIKSVDGRPWGAGGVAEAGDAAPGDLGSAAADVARDYNLIRDRAERVTEPVRAVDMWERFLTRSDLDDATREAAEAELAGWKKLYQDGAEKVRGSWVGGDELKEMKDEVKQLVEEAMRLEDTNPPDAMRKYQRALAKYPNAFVPHYRLAFIKFQQAAGQTGGNRILAEAENHARRALALRPRYPAVLSSMGAVVFIRRDYQRGLELMLQAVEIAPTDITVGNLVSATSMLPERFKRNNDRMREIALRAELLRDKFGGGGGLVWVEDFRHGLDETNPEDPDSGPPGLRSNGSGFFVSADGYLLTNRHVAETDEGFYYRVRLSDRDEDGNFIEYPARFVAADDEYDVALLKIELPEGETVPYLRIIQDDYPPVQIDVLTLGYPTTFMAGFNLQVSRGQVTTIDPVGDDMFDIYLDIKGTQGNSGGPIVDKSGHVIGILTAYRKVIDSIIVLAVGPRQIREFLDDVDEAPPLEFASPTDVAFNAPQLAEDTRDETLLVLVFAGDADEIEATDEAGEDDGEANGDDRE